jgi:hypothetical protein
MSDQTGEETDFGLVMPFWIDTDGYTDRDREMFVCGYEFRQVYQKLKAKKRGLLDIPVHTENASRFRMMCGKLGLRCEIKPVSGNDEWCEMRVIG